MLARETVFGGRKVAIEAEGRDGVTTFESGELHDSERVHLVRQAVTLHRRTPKRSSAFQVLANTIEPPAGEKFGNGVLCHVEQDVGPGPSGAARKGKPYFVSN
ncbi:hypothetical protein LZC95_21345 [Pendulispora brunnea]|uniref:Uncharacterized protein n=1 Tax=Pendulispora brunnea TaxID=2905690 RepID=A0ABZ2KQT7_9BACT